MYAQHRNAYSSLTDYMGSDVVVDLRGERLTETVIEEASEILINNHAYPDTLLAPPVVLSDFAKNFLSYKQIFPNSQQITQGIMGQRVNAVQTQFGQVNFRYDKFLKKPGFKKQATAATSQKAPNAPTAGGAPTAVVNADGASLFAAGDAGDYYYAVSAINRYGESSLLILNGGGADTVAASDRVDLQFVDGGGAYPATAYQIYRSAVDDANSIADVKFYPLFTVSTAQVAAGYDGAAATKVGDRNRWLPDTQEAMLFEDSTDVYEFKQLAPLMKMNLAVLSPATRFMVLLYGTLQLYAPGKMVRFINIGRTAPA